MLTLDEVRGQTDEVFAKFERDEEPQGTAIPEPSPHWRRRLEALEEAHLDMQRRGCLFDMRCEQAKTMGFEQLLVEEMVEMLMGEPATHNKYRNDLPRQSNEWVCNHHNNTILEGEKCNWGGHPTDFWRMEKIGLWFLPPFSEVETWRCRFGKLDFIKRSIPYGVVLRIQEMKALKLFNSFQIVAPQEAWEAKTDIDPIVMASIWAIEPNENENEKKDALIAGQIAHFFLAQW